jgi:hypothetical protein
MSTATTETTFDKGKVMERVRKMLALANDKAATEGERDNAMRMAHSTLAKYNLSLGDLSEAERAKQETRGKGQAESRDIPWCRTTAMAIGQLFFCEYFFVSLRGGKCRHYFVGLESNVATAIAMTQYAINSITREANAASKGQHGSVGSFQRSFAKGAASALYWRCDKIRKEAEQVSHVAASSGTSLVLASVYEREQKANQMALADMGISVKPRKQTQRNTRTDAFNSGHEYGNRIPLNKQIGG